MVAPPAGSAGEVAYPSQRDLGGRPRLWAGHCLSSPHRSGVLGWPGLYCSLRPPPHSAPMELRSSVQSWREPSHHPGRPAPPPRGRAALEPMLTWLVRGPPLPVPRE